MNIHQKLKVLCWASIRSFLLKNTSYKFVDNVLDAVCGVEMSEGVMEQGAETTDAIEVVVRIYIKLEKGDADGTPTFRAIQNKNLN